MKTKIQIIRIKILSKKDNIKVNHEKLMYILSELDGVSAVMVVTPECFLDGYVTAED